MEPTVTSAVAPASAPAPAAATAATSQPAAPVTSAAPITPAAAPATEALSPDASIQAMLDAANARGFNDEGTPEVPKTPEPVAPKVEAKPEPKEKKEPEPVYTLEEDGFVGAKDLAGKLDKEAPHLAPTTRNELMANARLAEAGAAYREIFASPAEAKAVLQTAQEYAGFSEAFNAVAKDVEQGTSSLIMKLIEASALRDDKGEPMKREDGSFVTDGTASKFLTTAAKRWFTLNVENKVKTLNDENVQAAFDLVMESVGMRPSTAQTDDDPALQARKAELDAQETRIREQQETAHKQAKQEYDTALNGDLASLYDGEVGKLMDLASGLEKFTKTHVEKELETALRTAIRTNTAYQMRKNRLQTQPRSAVRRQAEVALAREFFRDNLARIARPIFAEAGVVVKGKIEERAAAQAARAENARSEVGGGGHVKPASSAGSNQSPHAAMESAKAEYKRVNGHNPSDSELNIFMMLRHHEAKGSRVA